MLQSCYHKSELHGIACTKLFWFLIYDRHSLPHHISPNHTLTLTIDFALYIPKVFLSLGFLLIRSSCSRWLPFFIHYPKGEHSSCKKQQQITHSTREEVFLAIVIVLREMSKRVSINLSILFMTFACLRLALVASSQQQQSGSNVEMVICCGIKLFDVHCWIFFLIWWGRIVIVFISYHIIQIKDNNNKRIKRGREASEQGQFS